MKLISGGKTVQWPSSSSALAVVKSASPLRSPSPAVPPSASKTKRRRLRACMHGPRRVDTGKCPRKQKPRYVCMYGPRGVSGKCPRAYTAARTARAKAAAKAGWTAFYAKT